VRNESTKRAFWKLAIIESLIIGQDGVARAVIVKVANSEGRMLLNILLIYDIQPQSLVRC